MLEYGRMGDNECSETMNILLSVDIVLEDGLIDHTILIEGKR